MNPTHLPYVSTGYRDSDITGVGGRVVRATAEAALLIGDVVLWSVANKVNKSTTPADYYQFAGVVVGGAPTNNRVVEVTSTTSLAYAAAGAGQDVLIQIDGIAWMVSGAAITFPNRITVDTGVAGRVIAWVNTFVVGSLCGAAAGGAGEWIKVHLNPRMTQ